MLEASKEYKAAMKKTLRNRAYMQVLVGVVNHQAQHGAYIENEMGCTYYSNLRKPFHNYQVDEQYAVCDKNYTKLDGAYFFMPKKKDSIVLNQGIVAESIGQEIEIRFPVAHDIKGLTIIFGQNYPVDFAIEYRDGVYHFYDNRNSLFVSNKIFNNTDYIKIIPYRLSEDDNRLRIHNITMGVGLYFDSSQIISSSKRESISPIMETLYNLDFHVIINNANRLFDIENTDSSIHFLKNGQKISVLYGLEMDDGKTYWQDGCTAYLRTWSADDMQMSLKATDIFDGMERIYYKGRYEKEGISLYDLAVDVFVDAGIDTREFWIDEYLKKVKVCNPIPLVTHKEALQMIANAGRCLLGQDRKGRIFLQSAFVPEAIARSEDNAYYSDAMKILENKERDVYAQASKDFIKIGATRFFMPKSELTALKTSYISDSVADERGYFLKNPKIEIEMESAYKCFGLKLQFGNNHPKKMILHSFLYEELKESYELDIKEAVCNIQHEFPTFDKLALEFVQGASHNRIILDALEFGASTDYILSYGTDLLKTPKGSQLEEVGNIEVIQTVYGEVENVKEIAKITLSGRQTYTFYSDKAVYDIFARAIVKGVEKEVSIENQSDYRIEIQCDIDGDYDLIISGKEYIVSEKRYIRGLYPTGKTEVWKNPLVSDERHAKDIAAWLSDYFSSDKEYQLEYRGEPRIDMGDIVYLEHAKVNNLSIQVYEHDLNFNGALSGTIKARRYIHVDSTKDGLERG